MPDGEALIFGERRFTWADLNRRANRIANALRALGVGPGSRVAYMLQNSVEQVDLFFATAKLGAINVRIIPRSVGREIAFIVEDVGAQVMIAADAHAPLIAGMDKEIPSLKTVIGLGRDHGLAEDYETLLAHAPDTEPDVEVAPDAVFGITYTSGTTGFPKGCVRTHRQYLTNVNIYLAQIPHFDTDRAAIAAPLAAGFALHMLSVHACRGIPTLLLPKFDVAELMAAIERERITIAQSVGSTFAQFARHPDIETFDFSSLRQFYFSTLLSSAWDDLQRLRALPTFNAKFVKAYGSSETGGFATHFHPDEMELALSDSRYAHRFGSVGREAPFTTVQAVDDELRPLPAGQVGTMTVRSPSIISGYWNRPEESAEVLRDGMLITGDLMEKDEDGFIYLRGRKRDMIKTGGVSVYPAEIEALLDSHEKIEEVAVIGVPDERWGEKVVACVVARAECSEAEIIDYAGKHLAGFKKPKMVVFLDSLPKNPSEKVLKNDLRDMLAER
jgi:acyl-CoA synthetase (AMP-forming)/AMP-acid ligase II